MAELTCCPRDRERGAEIDRLRAELAAMTQRAETAEDTVGCQADLDKDFADVRAELAEAYRLRDAHHTDAINSRLETESLRAELAAKDARIAELEVEAFDRIWKHAKDTARAEQAEAQLADAKAALTKYGDHGAFQALRDGADRAERSEKRVAELEALGKRMSLAADSNGLGWMPLFDEARETFQGMAELNND
jgi:hypothetical protein